MSEGQLGRIWLAAVSAAVGVCAFAAAASAAVSQASGTPPRIIGPKVASVHRSSAVQQPCVFTVIDGIACYGPFELGKAYNFPANLDGRGQTIVIVDAYGSDDIQQDLDNFSAFFGIPSTTVKVIRTRGTGAADGSNAFADWNGETTLDVEYAHAMAPGARIVLAVAASDDNNDINEAEAEVLPRYPGAIVSQSFGEDENAPDSAKSNAAAHAIYVLGTLFGDTFLASTGDFGASAGDTPPVPVASFPASDPFVLAIGGTQGNPYFGNPLGLGLFANGGYGAEEVWNELQCCGIPVAGGGAPSVIFGAPPWQSGFSSFHTRTVPDVSYNAAVLGGVEIVQSCFTPDNPNGCDPSDPFFGLIGGTSAGSPQWAAIVAIANQARGQRGQRGLGLIAPALYRIARDGRSYGRDFHDITVGNNVLGSGNDPGADPSQGFFAKAGYDLATGLGTPNVANLVGDLVGADFFDGRGLPGPGQGGNGGRGDRWHQRHPHTAEPGG